jgi:hypothetical protein
MKTGSIGRNKTTGLIACAGVLLVLAIWLAGRIAGRTGVTDPSVRVVAQASTEGASVRREQQYRLVERVIKGEVATTAERVQEATGLALAASLLVASELSKGRAPASADGLVTALLQRELLPGFSKGGQPGTLLTSNGALAVRYRRAPIGIEVVSIGNAREAGQAILIRMPTSERENESGIWLAESLDEVVIPRPFAPAAEVIAAGWKPDTLPPIQ